MGAVLGWLPVVWAMRIALLVLLVGCSYVYLLLVAPFFRPANIWRMVKADLPASAALARRSPERAGKYTLCRIGRFPRPGQGLPEKRTPKCGKVAMTREEAEKISAEFCAIHAYYMCLADHAERATRGECPAPLVPRLAELRVVDGWVVWGGRPVWSPAENALTSAQPLRTRWTPSMAKAAYIEAREQELDATRIHFQYAAERVRSGNGSHESRAFRLAKIAFLESLVEQERRALRGDVAAPEVPDSSELELVDGWLMWKGRPVWWSGERTGGSASPAVSTPTECLPAAANAPARERPRLRRLLALPWRRAAA